MIDFILHIDIYLANIVSEYHTLTYGFLFLIIFAETGLVVTPFLPGDSLLFAAGALASLGSLDIWTVFIIILAAAILGDAVNYHIGKFVGPKVFSQEKSKFFNKKHLDKAHIFYEKYGPKTIVLARFVPLVRTFAPFVAGIGLMSYPRFLSYNVIGAFLWTVIFVWGGYWFGNIGVIQRNFHIMILAIILVSILPIIKEIFTHFMAKKKNESQK